MRRAFLSIGLLLLCCTPALAAPPADLAAFLKSLDASGACPSPIQTAAVQSAAAKKDPGGGVIANAYCSASCGSYSINCSGGTCSAADRNCAAGQRGFVQCDGAYTYCPVCNCQEGAIDYRDSGCCLGGQLKTKIYECINGVWVLIDTECGGVCW